jgi:hypothetical protein
MRVWLAMGRAAMNKRHWEIMGERRWSVTDPSIISDGTQRNIN